MPFCSWCRQKLYSGIGRRELTDGTLICAKCTYYNEHLRNEPGVKFFWVGNRKSYYTEAPSNVKDG